MTRHLLVAAALAGCATQAPTVPAEEEAAGAVGTISAPSPAPELRTRTSIASRSRRTADPHGTGSHTLSVTCYAYTGNRTASGKWPQVGMAASNHYPFGTRLLVQSVGVVTIEDRIGHGSDLDLYGPSERYCRQFGRQRLFVQVLR